MKEVVIIGSGNMAEALAKAVAASSYTLKQLFARNETRGKLIAAAAGTQYADDPALQPDGDHNDTGLPEELAELDKLDDTLM